MSEFEDIAKLFRPLTFGAPEALELMDDAAVVPSRPGFDLVITKDAIVEGVHFLPGDPPSDVARKLLRVNLSDLAAKGAEPYGVFLAVAWPNGTTEVAREVFAAGLGADLRTFGAALFGGDTVSTPGPFTASLTALGWVPAGKMLRRGAAKAGDRLFVSGYIGDGGLGLQAAKGELSELGAAYRPALLRRYRLPEPRLDLRTSLLSYARAAADVSDGLLADAGHIGQASGVGVEVRLEALPLSPAGSAWLARRRDKAAALAELAGFGDDYEIVCAAEPRSTLGLEAAGFTHIGEVVAEPGLRASYKGKPVALARTGWTHGG